MLEVRSQFISCALALGLATGMSGPTFASDISSRPAPAWRGCYMGAHAGYAKGTQSTTDMPFAVDGLGLPVSWNDPTGNMLGAGSDGAIGGGQAGCDYSAELNGVTLVLGAVVDISALDASASGTSSVAADTHTSFDTSWMATLRGRLGFTTGNTLVYATGGVAFADIGVRAFDNESSVSVGLMDVSGGGTETGWVAGAGLEWRLPSNLTLSLEYLHAEFDGLAATGAAVFPATATPRFESDLEIDTVRVGLNWHL